MLAGNLALTVAALFTGAAFYVNFAEQPARLTLDDHAMVAEWQPAYKRGFAMQAPLAVLGCALGIAAWWQESRAEFLFGGLLMLANWPWTIYGIMPTNNSLMGIKPADAGTDSRALIVKWNRLHAVRTALGGLAAIAFLLGLGHA